MKYLIRNHNTTKCFSFYEKHIIFQSAWSIILRDDRNLYLTIFLLLLPKFIMWIVFFLKLDNTYRFFCYFSLLLILLPILLPRFTNADLKICRRICLHIYQKFHLIKVFRFWDIHIFDKRNFCLQTYRNKKKYPKQLTS